MVDSPSSTRTSSVPEIKPLDQYDFERAKTCASVRWLLSKWFGSAENIPAEFLDPLYKDQYDQEHLKPGVSKLLLSPEIYCRAQSLLVQTHQGSGSQGSPSDISALLQHLTKKGLSPNVQDVDVSEEDLSRVPIKTKSHLALIDSLMSLSAKETVDQVKMAAEAEHMGVGAPWENALLFWVNMLNQKLRECTEDEETSRSQTCTDLQSAKETSNRWYWKLVPIRYRKDRVQSKLTPTFPLVSAVKDLSNGCAIAALLHFYCPGLLPLEDVCLKDTMSLADSLYNLQLIKDFCESRLQSCCPLAVEDLLYAPPVLHLNIMNFIAELLEWFEIKKPDFVRPVQPLDLTDVSELLDCTSPVSGNSNSGSPSFIFKQPFVPLSSVSPVSENKSWTKKQISRPLSAVTFSIPFGLDSDVDIVMGNPIDSVFRSVSTDNLPTGVPAIASSMTSSGMTRVPYSPPEDLSHLVSASAPSQRSSWGPYAHTAPIGELPTIEEALHVANAPNSKDRKKARIPEKGTRGLVGGRLEPRLCPEGAPAGFFLHCPEADSFQLSSSAPSRSGVLYRPVGGDVGGNERQQREERREKPSQRSDMSRDDDSVLRDGSVDSSDTSDDAPKNAPGNIRPSSGHHGNNSPRMTSFAERRDNRRRYPATPGEESFSAPTPTTPGTPNTPSTPVKAPGPPGSEPSPEALELGARLEEKRKSIEAQKRRIEAIFAKHRQRLGKTAFLQLKREKGEGGGNVAEDDLSLEERLTRMEEQLKQEEEKEEKEGKDEGEADDKESRKTNVCNPPRLEKQVTFSVDSKKEPEKEKPGEPAFVEYNEVVNKLSEALQSLQRDMQKLTEQQQQLLGNQRPRNSHKTTPKSKQRSNVKTPPQTPPHTPSKTPPRTPTKVSTRSSTKAWVIPAAPHHPTSSSPSRRSNVFSLSTSPKTTISSSCPAPRTKIHAASSTPRSPKHHQRQQNQRLHPRPSDLKVPTFDRVLVPTQTVDTLPHLRRVSPSKCQVQTSSSFRIGGPRTPQESPQLPPQPDESTSETGSSETPTQFSLELEQEQEEVQAAVGLPVNAVPNCGGSRAGGSSSGAPSECSFESETFSISAAYSAGGEGGRSGGVRRSCNQMEASLSSLVGPDRGSDVPTDEGQEFSSDSMSDHTESAAEPGGGLVPEIFEPLEQLNHEAVTSADPSTSPAEQIESKSQTEPSEPNGELVEQETRGGIGFFFKDDLHNEEEMAQRRALLLDRQQRRTEELKKRRQWNELERENRSVLLDKSAASPSHTPPAATTSPSPTPPATPARRGDFTRGEYARRQQLRIMEDLDKILRQQSPTHGRSPTKKSRARPRSMTREETKLSLSPAKGIIGSKLTKEYSHSSINLAARDESGNNLGDSGKKVRGPSSRPESPSGGMAPNKQANQNAEKEPQAGCNGSSSAQEYTGPKLFKEPSFKSNKFIIHNALSRCCLAGKVNEAQKTKIVEEMEKSSANHFLILFRDSSCQFRGVYTMNLDSQELVRLAGVGPRTVTSAQVESIYKYSSDRKQFSAIPSKTMGMTVDAFTIPGHLWHGGGGGGGAGGGGRRTSLAKKPVTSK